MIRELDVVNTVLTETSNKKYLWDGVEIVDERDTTGANVTKRFYSQGFVDNDGTNLYYTRDHLGSVRELTDSTQAVRARYDYDPYGRMTKIQGDKDSPFTYTGHLRHAQSGLDLTMYRAYDPNLGRWISRDPAGEAGDINLYGYVGNSPINSVDPDGLQRYTPGQINCIGYAAGFGCMVDQDGISTAALLAIQGWKCTKKNTKDCKCNCDQEKLVVFMHIGKPGAYNPFADPWPRGSATGDMSGNDVHGVHQDSDGTWSHMPGQFPVDTKPSSGITDPESKRPPGYNLTYCCCRSKK